MVTAYKEYFTNSFSGGCDDYILKPVSADKLIPKIEEQLNPEAAGGAVV